MNLLARLDAMDAFRDRHYCPCCKDRLHADDMDLGRDWRHSDAMRARYGATCCKTCTDAHMLTADGLCMPRDAACYSDGLDAWFSDYSAARAAEMEAAA